MQKLVRQKPAPFLAVLNNNHSVFIVLRIYNSEALLTKQPLLEELTAYMWPPSIHLSRLLSHTYCCMQFSVAGGDGGGRLRRLQVAAASRRDYDDGGGSAATRQLSHHPDPSSSFTAIASSSAFTTVWTVKSVIFGFTCMQQFLKVYLQRPACARSYDSICSMQTGCYKWSPRNCLL